MLVVVNGQLGFAFCKAGRIEGHCNAIVRVGFWRGIIEYHQDLLGFRQDKKGRETKESGSCHLPSSSRHTLSKLWKRL